MKIFLDTSALAKRYIQEPGSEELEELFLSKVGVLKVAEKIGLRPYNPASGLFRG